jgi:hypothetical protein
MLNLLVSWPYLGNEILKLVADHADHVRLLVDSGAFTNWKKGVDTDVRDYIAFIMGLPVKPWRYFTLDRVGDPVDTARNLETMLDAGLEPVPVFTRGSPVSALEELYRLNDLVGIGVGVGTPGYLGYIRWITEQLLGRPAHWLGVTTPALVAYYRPYSCDCSNWETGARYGSIPLYLGRGEIVMYTRRKAALVRPSARMWKAIQSCGFSPADLQKESAWRGGRSVIRKLGAASWVRYSLEAEERFGTRVFLAATTVMACELLLDAYLQAKGIVCNGCFYHREASTASPGS